MYIPEIQPMRRVDYWRMAWKKKPPSRFFTPYRAIPSLLAAAGAFLVKYLKNRSASPMDTWIAIGTIFGVYLVLYAIESLWIFAVVSPVNLHNEQTKTISDLTQQNSKLYEAAYPKISPEEESRRELVSKILKACGFSEETKSALRSALNFEGEIRPSTTGMSPLGSRALAEIMGKGVGSGLITREGRDAVFKIRPNLQAALRFVLKNEEK